MINSHPLKKWLCKRSLSLETFAGTLQQGYGLKASTVYLKMIAEGYYAPGKNLALAICKETGISLEKLIRFPYAAPRHNKKAS